MLIYCHICDKKRKLKKFSKTNKPTQNNGFEYRCNDCKKEQKDKAKLRHKLKTGFRICSTCNASKRIKQFEVWRRQCQDCRRAINRKYMKDNS